MNEKIKNVLSEDLGEGYRIVRDNGELSPAIEWVDWIADPETGEPAQVEVTFEDDSEETFAVGVQLRQIWHEDVK